jgi:predicted ATP-grasp superfamily ATP-dependent carboligase
MPVAAARNPEFLNFNLPFFSGCIMKSVLITYGWVRSSYAALRNLTDHGIPVDVADSLSLGMCQVSRRKKSFSLYRSHYDVEAGFVADIVDICKKRSVGFVLPSHNETEVLARHRSQLEGELAVLLPQADHCALFNDKSRSYDLAQACQVPVSRRVSYDSPADVAIRGQEEGIEKYVIKLLTGNSAKGVFYADSACEAETVVKNLVEEFQLSSERFPQVEEYVRGEGWGVSVLYWHGKYIASFTHRRIREKIATGGTSTLREAALNLAIEHAARSIFDSIGWHGLAMCEFKVCPETGRFWFIEVNPRLWGSISLAVSAGVEFPYLAWLCASMGEAEAMRYHQLQQLKLPWRSRWFLGDLLVAAKALSRGRIREMSEILFEANADYVDDWFWDDPLVFFGEVGVYLKRIIAAGSLNPGEEGMVR